MTIRFLSGQRRVTRPFQAGDNQLVEDDITVTWTLQEGEGYTASAVHGTASVVLEESEFPKFSVSADPGELAEGESATVTVEITNGVRCREAQTIDLSASGTASASDYTGLPATLRLGGFQTTATTATLTAVADQEEEQPETVVVTASHVGSEIGTTKVAITANDAAPLTAEFVGVPESHDGQRAFRFTLQFSEPVSLGNQALRTTVLDVTGGVVRGTRRVTPGVHLSWWIPIQPASEADVEVVLPVTTDCASTGAVCTASGKALSNRLQATVRGPTSVSIAGSNTVVEGAPLNFTLVRTGTTDDRLTVTVAVAETGSMLSGRPPTTVIFAAGAETALLSMATNNDTVSEPSSIVTARVVAGSGYEVASSSSADSTVTDNDVAEFSVSANPVSVGEGGNSTVTVAISNGVTFAMAQTIMLTAEGTAAADDYTLAPPTLALTAEASSATATLTAADDGVAEPEETVVVTATLDGIEIGSAAVAINASEPTPLGTPPVADAGWDLTLAVDEVAYLDGSGSTGDVAMIWEWSFVSWPGADMPHLDDPSGATPSFVPTETGTHVVRLTVSDGSGTASDTVTVTAVMATDAGSLMQANLWADTNRDGSLDAADDVGEDTWGVSTGAVFFPNLDDDDGDEVRDGLDNVVNGIADLEDMTPLVVRRIRGLNRKHQVKLEMVGVPAMDWPRVFLKRGEEEFELLIGDGAHRTELAAADLVASDAELYLDSPYGRSLYLETDTQLYTEFDGNVRLRLSVHDGNTMVSEDEIALRGTPILFSHHQQPAERVFVVDAPDNQALVGALRSHLPAHVDLIEFNQTKYRVSLWVQDFMQTGYAQRVTATGLETGRTHVLLRPFTPFSTLMTEAYLGPGAGYAEPPGWYFRSSLNLGGNLELIPPHRHNGRHFPYGRIVIGKGMQQRPIDFFEAQGAQTPAIEVDVSWLYVSHVDEVFQIVPDHNASPQDRGWVVAIASPDLAIDLLEAAQDGGWGGAVVFAGRDEETTIDEILADSHLLDYNDETQAAVDAVRQALIAEVGLTDDDFREVPAMWFLDRRWAESYFPSIQNLLVVDDVLFLADPEGPDVSGADLWQQAARDAFDGLGYDIHFVDVSESYHLRLGSIHCGTNVEHAGETAPWWLVE